MRHLILSFYGLLAIRTSEGARLKFREKSVFLILALCLVLLFQNCGEDYAPVTLYGQNSLNSADCISDVVDCGPRAEFLQVSIDNENPLVFPPAQPLIAGRCNVGNYLEHYIAYEVKNSNGDTVLSKQRLGNICIKGKYEFSLALNTFRISETHTLVVTVEGIDENGTTVTNASFGGSAQIDFYRQ
jgi:hypothetical protein